MPSLWSSWNRSGADTPGKGFQLTLKVVLDTCVLKLATFPAADNPSALIVELALKRLMELWVTPAILEEYSHVLSDEPEFLSDIFSVAEICYPLTELGVIRHEPDNRFLECALAVEADFIVSVNTSKGHFDRKQYGTARVAMPGAFLASRTVERLVCKLK
jgi:predicted nucleic acid-binding protein